MPHRKDYVIMQAHRTLLATHWNVEKRYHDRENNAVRYPPDKTGGKPTADSVVSAAVRVRRRLLLSSLQLVQLLTVTLGDLRLSLELRRLHRVLAAAAAPLVATILKHHQQSPAQATQLAPGTLTSHTLALTDGKTAKHGNV